MVRHSSKRKREKEKAIVQTWLLDCKQEHTWGTGSLPTWSAVYLRQFCFCCCFFSSVVLLSPHCKQLTTMQFSLTDLRWFGLAMCLHPVTCCLVLLTMAMTVLLVEWCLYKWPGITATDQTVPCLFTPTTSWGIVLLLEGGYCLLFLLSAQNKFVPVSYTAADLFLLFLILKAKRWSLSCYWETCVFPLLYQKSADTGDFFQCNPPIVIWAWDQHCTQWLGLEPRPSTW